MKYIAFFTVSILIIQSTVNGTETVPGGITFDMAVDRLSETSGYTIELVGNVNPDDNKVNNFDLLFDQPILNAVRELLVRMNITGSAVVKDELDKKITVILSDAVMYQHTSIQLNTLTLDADFITDSQLQQIKTNHKQKMDQRTGDSVIYPATGDGPALTLGQLRDIKQKYYTSLNTQSDSRELFPEDGSGSGLTLGELKSIKESHRLDVQFRTTDTIILPESELGYGQETTLGKLGQIKENHRVSLVFQSDAQEILPSSEHGNSLTLGELKDIKEQYNKDLSQGKDKLIMLPGKGVDF